jgi:UDP-3-O-[3-hydroxymyristoyl] glucosamine N-acyltransferase
MQKNKRSVDEIATLINGKASKKGLFVCGLNSLDLAENSDVSFFVGSKKNLSLLTNTKALVVVLKKDDANFCKTNFIIVDDPYLAFSKLSKIFDNRKKIIPCTKESVKIGINSFVPKSSFVDDFVVIGDNVKIGENVLIYAGVKIEDDVEIGDNSIIHPNVVIKDNVKIGKNCSIFANATIGTDGFGYALDKKNQWKKINQLGSVIIGDFVDIGSNTSIDRGAIKDTIIEDGVKIDNQVQIGHNCIISKNSIIAGCVGIAGSTIIGESCRIGGAAMILGHLNIASETTISPGTMIASSINKHGKTYAGFFPFFEKSDWIKVTMFLKRLLRK